MCAYIHIFHQKSLMWVKIKLKQDIQSFDLIHMDHNVLANSTWTKPILDIRNNILKGADGSQITIGKASLYETLSCNTKVHNYKYINNKEDEQYCIFHDTNNEEKITMKNTQKEKRKSLIVSSDQTHQKTPSWTYFSHVSMQKYARI